MPSSLKAHLYHGLSKADVGIGNRFSYATPHSPPLSTSPTVPEDQKEKEAEKEEERKHCEREIEV